VNDLPAHRPDLKRDRDEALLADLTSPPSLEQAQESYDFWRQRADELPIYKRAERHEAQAMAERWKQRLAQAERDRYGPGLLEQVLNTLGVRRAPRLPSGRRVMTWLTVVAIVTLIVVVGVIVAVIAFWPHIQPVVHDLLNNQNGGSGG
jgi:hypothetical protein